MTVRWDVGTNVPVNEPVAMMISVAGSKASALAGIPSRAMRTAIVGT